MICPPTWHRFVYWLPKLCCSQWSMSCWVQGGWDGHLFLFRKQSLHFGQKIVLLCKHIETYFILFSLCLQTSLYSFSSNSAFAVYWFSSTHTYTHTVWALFSAGCVTGSWWRGTQFLASNRMVMQWPVSHLVPTFCRVWWTEYNYIAIRNCWLYSALPTFLEYPTPFLRCMKHHTHENMTFL